MSAPIAPFRYRRLFTPATWWVLSALVLFGIAGIAVFFLFGIAGITAFFQNI